MNKVVNRKSSKSPSKTIEIMSKRQQIKSK